MRVTQLRPHELPQGVQQPRIDAVCAGTADSSGEQTVKPYVNGVGLQRAVIEQRPHRLERRVAVVQVDEQQLLEQFGPGQLSLTSCPWWEQLPEPREQCAQFSLAAVSTQLRSEPVGVELPVPAQADEQQMQQLMAEHGADERGVVCPGACAVPEPGKERGYRGRISRQQRTVQAEHRVVQAELAPDAAEHMELTGRADVHRLRHAKRLPARGASCCVRRGAVSCHAGLYPLAGCGRRSGTVTIPSCCNMYESCVGWHFCWCWRAAPVN